MDDEEFEEWRQSLPAELVVRSSMGDERFDAWLRRSFENLRAIDIEKAHLFRLRAEQARLLQDAARLGMSVDEIASRSGLSRKHVAKVFRETRRADRDSGTTL